MGIRLLDVVGGIAESVDESLQKSIEESNEFARQMKVRKIDRQDADYDIYQKDLREARKVMKDLAGLTGGDIDKAAQIFKLGGSTSGAQKMVDLIREENLKKGKDFSLDGMIEFVQTETQGFGVEDYLTKLVRRPESLVKLPQERIGGVGLYEALFKPDYSKEIQRSVEAASPFTPVKEIDDLEIQTAKLLETTIGKEYAQTQEIFKLDKIAKELANKQALEELGLKDAFTNSEFRANIKTISLGEDIPLNEDGTINIQSAEDTNLNLSQALTDTVEITSKLGITATGTFKNRKNLATLQAIASSKATDGSYIVNINSYTKDTVPQIGKVYNLSKNNKNIPHIYLGADFGFLSLN